MGAQVVGTAEDSVAVVPRGTGVPHNDDAERAVLAAMLMDKDAALQAVNLVKAGDFYR